MASLHSSSSTVSGSGSIKSGDIRMLLKSRQRSNRMKNHKCELVNESIEPKNNYRMTFWRRLRLSMHRAILVSGTSKRSRIYLRSSAAVNLEEERQLLSPHWYIIHPFSKLRVFWACLMTISLLLHTVLFPLAVAFVASEEDATKRVAVGWFSVIHLLTLVFIVNICLNFITGVVSLKTREIILDPWRISRLYLHGCFPFDVLCIIPWELSLFFVSDSLDSDQYFNVLAIVVALSMFNFIRVVQMVIFLRELFEIVGFSRTAYRLTQLLVLYALYLHWAACGQYLIPILVYGKDLAGAGNSWLNQYQVMEEPRKWKRYEFAWSRAVSVTLRLGYGRYVKVQTIEDAVVSTVTLIIGFFFNAIIFGVFLHFIMARYASDLKYQSSMIQLMEYIRFKKLPSTTQERLFMYYENKFQKGYFNENAILATLSDSLREKISMHCCHRLVATVEIFVNLPAQVLVAIVRNLHQEIFLPTDVIIKAGLTGDCMYFMQTGTAAVYTPIGKEICHLQDGDYFGEVALIEKNARRVASVIALDICDVYRLDRADYLQCIATQHELLEKIDRTSTIRKEETFKLETAFKKQLQIDILI